MLRLDCLDHSAEVTLYLFSCTFVSTSTHLRQSTEALHSALPALIPVATTVRSVIKPAVKMVRKRQPGTFKKIARLKLSGYAREDNLELEVCKI